MDLCYRAVQQGAWQLMHKDLALAATDDSSKLRAMICQQNTGSSFVAA